MRVSLTSQTSFSCRSTPNFHENTIRARTNALHVTPKINQRRSKLLIFLFCLFLHHSRTHLTFLHNMISSHCFHSLCLFFSVILFFSSPIIWTFSHRLTFLPTRLSSILAQQISTFLYSSFSSPASMRLIEVLDNWQVEGAHRATRFVGDAKVDVDSRWLCIHLPQVSNVRWYFVLVIKVERCGSWSISEIMRLQIPSRPRPSVVVHWYSRSALNRNENKMKFHRLSAQLSSMLLLLFFFDICATFGCQVDTGLKCASL